MMLIEWLAGQRGRGAALARHLKIPPSLVAKIAAGKKPVPLVHCPEIQAFTESAVTCEELRPDARTFFDLVRRLAPPAGQTGMRDAIERRHDAAAAATYANTLADRRRPAITAPTSSPACASTEAASREASGGG
jgi:DNA-binding transcriptional regulator YdaS (Cro superfamily)